MTTIATMFIVKYWGWSLLILDITLGLLWLLYRFATAQCRHQAWRELTNEATTSFGKWTPVLGVLFGFVSFTLMICQIYRDRR